MLIAHLNQGKLGKTEDQIDLNRGRKAGELDLASHNTHVLIVSRNF